MDQHDCSDVLDAIRQKILTCTLCSQRFGLKVQAHLPICLDCSHTFCFACLTRVRLGMGIFSTIACPTCGLETTAGVSGVSGLNRNETTISLINIMETHEKSFRQSAQSIDSSNSSRPPSAMNHTPNTAGTGTKDIEIQDQSDVVENVVITIAQYRRVVTDEAFKRIASRAGCGIELSIPHISLFSDPPPAVGIVTFRGNQMQINDGKSLLRKYLRDFRHHSFTTNFGSGDETFVPSLVDRTHLKAMQNMQEVHQRDRESIVARPKNNEEKPLEKFSRLPQRQTQSFTGRAVSSNSPFTDIDELEKREKKKFFRICLKCDCEAVGNLIGPGGVRIREMSELTSCQLSTNPLGEDMEKQNIFNVEMVGPHDKISIAVPFVKMVIGRGESAMRKVREFYASHSHQPTSDYSPYQGHRSFHSDSLSHSCPPGLKLEYPSPASSRTDDESSGLCNRAGVSIFDPTIGTPLQDGGKLKGNKDSFTSPPSHYHSIPSTDILNTVPDIEELSEGSAVGGDEEIHVVNEVDDIDDDTLSNKSPLPYTISPPSSPLPSKTFPNYFIQPRLNKRSEIFSMLRVDISALFSEDGHTPLASEIMRQSRCDISWVQHPPGFSSATENLKISGDAVDREKAKFLLSTFKKAPSSQDILGDGVFSVTVTRHQSEECVSRCIDCPAHFIPVLIGTGGYTIEDIQTRTSTRILINDHKDEDQPPQICIIGTPSGVEEALSCIEKLLMNHRFKYRQRPFSPSQRTRSLTTNPTSPEGLVSFSSSPPVHFIKKAASDGGTSHGIAGNGTSKSPSFSQSKSPTPMRVGAQNGIALKNEADHITEGSVTTQLLCPGDKVSQLIGKKGSILRELKRISNCDISIERVTMPGDDQPPLEGPSPPQLVHISGISSDVKEAVRLVDEVIALGPVVALKMQTVKMIIPHDKVPLVIGQRGITAKEMMRRSGCKIHVNETVDVDNNCFIELTGTSEQLSGAQELISHVLEHGTKALGKKFQKP